MKNTKLTVIFLTTLLVLPSFYLESPTHGKTNISDTSSDTPIIDLFRILKIDFEPPALIQDCGSLFLLNVTITKIKFLNLPKYFSISVYLKTNDEYGKSDINLIGSQPFIFLPSNQRSKTISIQCFTNKNLYNNIYRLFSDDKCKVDIYKGSIGVRIDRLPLKTCIDGIMWRGTNILNKELNLFKLYTFITLFGDVLKKFSLIPDGETVQKTATSEFTECDIYPKNKIRLISRFQLLKSHLITMNRRIEWRDVRLIPPFVCSEDIYLDDVDIDETTDSGGNFTVNLTIVNHLDYTVNFRGDVDVSETPILNSILPSFKSKFYSVGFFRGEIPANRRTTITIECTFPKNRGFLKRNYDVKVECAPYISIEDTNLFGFFFFDIRWKTAIGPKYYVNGTVENSIKKMWYNSPIFYGDPGSSEIFPNYQTEIFYNGTTVEDLVEEIAGILNNRVETWLLLYFLFTLMLIGFAFICYYFIRRYPPSKFK